MDYRALNAATVRQLWPAARTDTLLSSFSGSKWFSVIDLNAAFHQIGFSTEQDAELAAFVTESGHYQMKCMPFGLTNAPAIMQQLIDRVLAPHKRYALAYMDDIVIFSATFEDHVKHIDEVLRSLTAHSLAIKPSKCRFAQRQVRFLGFVVSGEGISTDPAYVRGITEFPSPNDPSLSGSKKVARLISFLGIVGYYRRFSRQLATMERPLRELTLKDAPWHWEAAQQHAFDEIKLAISSAPVLAHPDFSRLDHFIISTDASKDGIGAVLSQVGSDDIERPIFVSSRATSVAESRYAPTALECLAVVYYLRYLSFTLLGRSSWYALITGPFNGCSPPHDHLCICVGFCVYNNTTSK